MFTDDVPDMFFCMDGEWMPCLLSFPDSDTAFAYLCGCLEGFMLYCRDHAV